MSSKPKLVTGSRRTSATKKDKHKARRMVNALATARMCFTAAARAANAVALTGCDEQALGVDIVFELVVTLG